MKTWRGAAALLGALILLCVVVALEWYAHTGRQSAPQPVQQISAGSPSPSPQPGAPTVGPSASPTPAPTPSPVTYVPVAQPSAPTSGVPAGASAAPYAPGNQVTEAPIVAATLAPHVVSVKPIMEPANAPPRILAMSLSTPVAYGGQIVSGTVETSSNVASVEARIAGYSSSLQKVGVGKFSIAYRVPRLPFFLHRTYTIEVIARNTRGDAVRSAVPITVR